LPRGFFFLAGDDVVLSHLAYTLFSKKDGGVKGELVAHLCGRKERFGVFSLLVFILKMIIRGFKNGFVLSGSRF